VARIVEQAPITYQKKNKIDSWYILEGNKVSFGFGKFNINETLIIDPTLIFASYSGFYADNFGMTATYDDEGKRFSEENDIDIQYLHKDEITGKLEFEKFELPVILKREKSGYKVVLNKSQLSDIQNVEDLIVKLNSVLK